MSPQRTRLEVARARGLTRFVGRDANPAAGYENVRASLVAIACVDAEGKPLFKPTDVAALGISLFAMRLAQKPPTASKTFGYHRVEILAAESGKARCQIAAMRHLDGSAGIRRQPQRDHVGRIDVVLDEQYPDFVGVVLTGHLSRLQTSARKGTTLIRLAAGNRQS